MKFQQVIFLCCSILLSTGIFSQAKTGTLSGSVIEQSAGTPVELASVELLRVNDSIPFQTTLTDKQGRFSFFKIPFDRYIIRTGLIGQESKTTEVSLANPKLHLDPIGISSSAKEMKEVTVSDLFKTMRQKSAITSLELSQVSIGRRDSRVFYLGISNRFGSNNKKPQEEKIEFDDGL